MKTATVPGSTSQIRHVFIGDSTSTAGAGKTALVFSDITAYYVRSGGALTALTMVDITTLGTWDTDVIDDKLGFKLLNDTNAPGIYEIHLPNNILTAGADTVVIQLRATDAVPCNLEIQLDDVPMVEALAAVSAISGVKRGVALANLCFTMTLDRAPVTGLTVTSLIKKDAGAFGSTTNSVAEVGNGVYAITLTATEMTAAVVVLRFTATGSDDLVLTIPIGS